MSTSALVPTGPATLPVFTLSPEFLEKREDAIASASLIARVSNAAENALAVEAQRKCTVLVREVEAARKRVKEPVLDLGRRIDTIAREATAPIEAALAPVVQLISDFQAAERERERREQARIEAERAAAEREAMRLRLAEEARIQAEARAAMESARSRAEADHIAHQAELARLAAAEAEVKAKAEAQERAAMDMQVHAAAKAHGQSVRMEWEVNVVDLWALARAHPACVTITPRLTEIKAILSAGGKVAGVTAKQVPVVSVRGGKAVEV